MSNLFPSPLLAPEHQTLLKAVQDRLTEYVSKMSPGQRITATDGAFQQRQLWQGVINTLLQQPPPVFIDGWTYFLTVVHQNRQGCFSPAYMNRFREELRLTTDDRRNFERLLHLAYVTADASSRALSLRQIDMNQILVRLPNELMRQKIVAFYGL